MEIKILTVDDEIDVSGVIESTADLMDVEADSLSNPNDLDDTDVNQYSLIFLDLMMPEKDGIEVLRELSERSFSGYVVLMSGMDNAILNTARELATEHNLKVLDHLNKPFRVDDIEQIISRAQDLQLESKVILDPLSSLTEEQIKEALAQQRVVVHYQPQVDLISHRLVGMEALVRIQAEDGELIYPDRFISVAEQSHIIHDLTKTVIERAFSEFKELLKEHAKLTLSVNLSSDDLQDLGFVDWILEKARQYDISTSKIILEVTETQEILSYSNAMEVLGRLRLRGFKVSIDDFGTGNAVLDQIKRLPATELKIDRTFVFGLKNNDKSKVLIRNTINMCRELDLDVVAEGVEDSATEELLRSMGCQIVQGFLYSKPIPFSEIEALIVKKLKKIPTDTVCSEGGNLSEPEQVSMAPNGAVEEKPEPKERKVVLSKRDVEAEHLLSFILPLSGRFSFIGESHKVGAELAFEAHLRQYPDLKLGLEFLDDQSELEVFAKGFNKLSENTLAVVGPTFPIIKTEEFLKHTRNSDIPILAPFNGCDQLRNILAKQVYNFKPGFKEELSSIAAKLREKNGRTVCFIPHGRLAGQMSDVCHTIRGAESVIYHSDTLKESVANLKIKRPNHVVFLGAAKTLVQLIDEINIDQVEYYATSLVGTGMVKKLLSRKAKLKLEITEPLPDYQSDLQAASEFRLAAKLHRGLEDKWINTISFESFLATKLLLNLYELKQRNLSRKTLKSSLEELFSYDLGLDVPLSWAEENRQLLHHVYHIEI
ncbi:EAL domain-containing protein [Thiomicrorhabdus sp. ZW0627]|uniref:EAL domain-containing protein n=1 Tax=Thiomicrorhabdus sp. ZW0627 TaxID=3039774 RepID=UPI002436725B|nr:EAL domain-containing protein [Thiomicrorhabdus sp. ZW0627]MDG6773819.1 EAL domain-containing protein [Thiomicrorhabdus sp. ZW0627]